MLKAHESQQSHLSILLKGSTYLLAQLDLALPQIHEQHVSRTRLAYRAQKDLTGPSKARPAHSDLKLAAQ
jgi:hypothetical protein